MMIANTPPPPYYAVIFTSVRTETKDGYIETAQRMLELAQTMPGYLGEESARNEIGITVSYWKTLEDIKAWKQHSEHLLAQTMGREKWYAAYKTRIALVERDYSFEI
jgi:heme-degrading monooxygenase HmoA